MNIIDGIQKEMSRCRELLKVYDGIPAGAFAASIIVLHIANGEKAIASGDAVEMLRAYKNLENCS